MKRSDVFLAHVASQLMFTWIDPFLGGDFDSDPEHGVNSLHELSPADWLSRIVSIEGRVRTSVHWLTKYLASPGGSPRKLATAAYNHVQSAFKNNATIIVIGDPEYPPLLRMIKDPPISLSIIGSVDTLENSRISIVGSRKACPRALDSAYQLAHDLAKIGYLTVSGGAYGCDIAAHQGVLASGGTPCLAAVVFAGGLGNIYPRGNYAVFREIVRLGGALISERLWNAAARPFDFPVRNRIVSGLSPETVVMQAGGRSGAMITAKLALDQGREVSVLKFSESEKAAIGNVRLAEDGASTFESSDEWLEYFGDRNSLSGASLFD